MGLAYVAPIGAQNLFVINAALTLERHRALLTALMVIFFDVTLALACFWWVGALMQSHVWLQTLMLISGSLVVMYIGQGLLRTKSGAVRRSPVPVSLKKICFFACVLTWFNPQAVIDGSMMLGAFHVLLAEDGAAMFISGVVTASAVWFLSLTVILSFFKAGFTPGILRGINICSGMIIMIYGMRLLFSGLRMLAGM